MSRAFVNEDNQEEAPLIPPRAPLPNGSINYVTPFGLQQLKSERVKLQEEMDSLPGDDDKAKRFSKQLIKGKLTLLDERIQSARLLSLSSEEKNEVRFGAIVTLKFEGENSSQTFQIVGVDEANVKDAKIAFTSPIARLLSGKKVGDQASLDLGNKTRKMSIVKISYD
ncbi:GreA/GreB family elongation factor [Ekhidna sp.]|uniref:GreA/GreB family elongation factor n=1 Tax=Ekhidna sp. TaxID=2608089 RepID=UPI003BAAAC26